MAYQCGLCGKKSHAGGQHTHHTGVAGGRWKKKAQRSARNIRPNLHWVTLSFQGALQRVRACTKCIKRAKFDLRKNASVVKLAA